MFVPAYVLLLTHQSYVTKMFQRFAESREFSPRAAPSPPPPPQGNVEKGHG